MNTPSRFSHKDAVLVVDDDPIFCEMLVADLTLQGLNVFSVSSLADAREIVRRYRFDIVLIDNHLPDGSGTSLLGQLKLLDPTPYVIMVSIDDQMTSISAGFSSGIHDYMVKPVSMELLLEKIRNLLSFKQANVELANKNHLLQQLLDEKAQEENLAQHVYRNIASAESDLPGFVALESRPMTSFSGDTLFAGYNPTGKIQLILADAMGHGLAAAICIIPIVTTARAMTNKGKGIEEIFHEINRKLYSEIPDDRFVALAGIEICPYTSTISFINAGLPPIICGLQNGELRELKSRAMPLGILEPVSFSIKVEQLAIAEVTQIALYTDGLIEQTNPAGDALSLAKLISESKRILADKGNLIALMGYCTHYAEGKSEEDDITLCVIDGEKLRAQLQGQQQSATVDFGEIDYRFCVRGNVLKGLDVLNQAMHIMQYAGLPKDLCQKAFTAMAELVNNALDHGILRLDSKLKNDVEGFANYLSIREERLENLNKNDELIIELYTNSTTFIKVSVEDSGTGFSLTNPSADKQGLSGRGLGLLDAICKTVERNTAGNRTTVYIERN
ncbi:PP2C family protein-serine/threonine phosphatase [Alteromonas gilva]|uniref:SpoIIE family protein phosphatase n=1 Tax=Alteromonas gilva TaxID=2987522 RepID=A0ABT5KXC5_9ALTE|nr:SpoIIE family protein phosphatase [Alteromonas gilva]MDC8829420.1 SpoIIE family protein phosphatase [Alteromonas gilva]